MMWWLVALLLLLCFSALDLVVKSRPTAPGSSAYRPDPPAIAPPGGT
jgi:hypothetical protein